MPLSWCWLAFSCDSDKALQLSTKWGDYSNQMLIPSGTKTWWRISIFSHSCAMTADIEGYSSVESEERGYTQNKVPKSFKEIRPFPAICGHIPSSLAMKQTTGLTESKTSRDTRVPPAPLRFRSCWSCPVKCFICRPSISSPSSASFKVQLQCHWLLITFLD